MLRVSQACALLLCLAAPANAVTMTKHYDFTMKYHHGAYSNIVGAFDATYDADRNGGVAIHNFLSNLPFAYAANAGSVYHNVLTLGTDCDDHGCQVTSGQDQFSFVFVIDPTGDVIYPYSFVYARAEEYALFEGNRTDLIVTPVPVVTGVPEPQSWAMMIAGIGAMGFARRRTRRTPQVI